MNAKEFLKEKLNVLALQFPNVQIKYAYNYSIATHVVELTPEGDYYGNEKLDAAWIPLSIEFSETFVAESICFISSDSRLAILHPEFEWNKPNEEWYKATLNNLFEKILHSSFELEFPNTFAHKGIFETHIVVETMATEYKPIAEAIGKSVFQQYFNATAFVQCSCPPKDGENAGNKQYAMAA